MAIFLTFAGVSLIYTVLVFRGVIHAPKDMGLIKLLAPAAFLFFVGLVDDLWGLGAKVKLAAQVGGAVSLYFSGYRFICFHSFANTPWMTALCLALTVFWVVLVCNAVNLIDGLDGLAAGAALFSMVTLFTFAIVSGRHGTALMVAVLAGANLGFLIFNFNPASIFLGDSGSLFIGFMLSGLIMAESQKQPDLLRTILVPVVALALPLTDLSTTILRRLISGNALFRPDRGHIHHKLLDRGLTQRQVVFVLYGVSATCALLSLLFLHPSHVVWVPAVALLLLFLFFGLRRLNYYEFSELGRLAIRLAQQKDASIRNIAVKRAAADLNSTYNTAAIVDTLKECLGKDFDAFQIILDQGFAVIGDGLEGNPTRKIESAWKFSTRAPIILTMSLSSPRFGRIGHISLEHGAGKRLLIDSELLQRELRTALGVALDRCLILSPVATLREEQEAQVHN